MLSEKITFHIHCIMGVSRETSIKKQLLVMISCVKYWYILLTLGIQVQILCREAHP